MGVLEIARGLFVLLFYQTSWSYLGRQGLGLKFALLWVARRREQRERIMEHCRGALNTNPFAAGAVVGTIARAEYDVQELRSIDRLATLAQSTLAAGGDTFFWQNLRPALTALGVLLVLLKSPFAPLGFLVAFVAVTQGTRALGLQLGYQQGREAIPILQGRFNRWTESLGWFAALVTGMVAAIGLLGKRPAPPPTPARWFGWTLTFGHVQIYWLLIPLAVLAYIGLHRRISQTYMLLIFLLIFVSAKLIL